VLAFVARYDEDVARVLAAGSPPRIRWIEYDWALNDLSHAERSEKGRSHDEAKMEGR
jgi:hypothetical protein